MMRSEHGDSGAAVTRMPSMPLSWDDRESVERAIQMLREHELFDAAMLRSARTIVDGFQSQPLLNLVMSDRGRFLFLTAALALYADPDANGNRLLPGRLAALCEECQICSRGRAKALMSVLRWAGYLEAGETSSDGRTRPMTPTELMKGTMRQRWRTQIETIAPLEPGVLPARLELDRDPELVCLFAKMFIAMFQRGFRVLAHAPALSYFAERNAGLPIVIKLYFRARAGGKPPSIAALSHRFSVSRGHVRQTIAFAEAQGLLSWDAKTGAMKIEPALQDAMTSFFATTLLLVADIAIRVMAERTTPDPRLP